MPVTATCAAAYFISLSSVYYGFLCSLSLSLKCVQAPHELFTSVRTPATNQQRPVNGHYLLIYSTLFQ